MSAEYLERTIAAAVVQYGASADAVRRLDPADFELPALAQVARAVVELRDAGKPVEPGAIVERLVSVGAGQGAERVVQMLTKHHIPDAFSWDIAIAKLRGASRRRRMVRAAERIADAAGLGDVAAFGEALTQASALVQGDDEPSYRVGGRAELLESLRVEIQARLQTPSMGLGKHLAPLARHLVPGAMIAIGGDTGAGKSTFALWLGRQWHRSRQRPMGVVSLEDPWSTWADRWQGERTGFSLLDSDYETGLERVELQHRLEKLSVADEAGLLEEHVKVADMRTPEVGEVIQAMTDLHRQGCTLLAIDYVQEIEGANKDDEGARELARVVGALKNHAKRLGVPLLLLSQFNRGKKPGVEPLVSDMKGSSKLEQASEGIVLLWRETADERSGTLGKVAKLKSSAKRPRFELVRNGAGCVEDASAISDAYQSGDDFSDAEKAVTR